MITVEPLVLYKNKGWLALDHDKKRGIFCYLSEGVFRRKDGTEIEYRKIRLADVHVKKHKTKGEYIQYTRGGKQQFSSIGFYVEMAPYALKIISKIYDEITGKPADGRQSKGVDDLLRRTGGRF